MSYTTRINDQLVAAYDRRPPSGAKGATAETKYQVQVRVRMSRRWWKSMARVVRCADVASLGPDLARRLY